jgi:site-specific recombinase
VLCTAIECTAVEISSVIIERIIRTRVNLVLDEDSTVIRLDQEVDPVASYRY